MIYTFKIDRKLQITSSKLELITADLNGNSEYNIKVEINFVHETGTQNIQRGPGYLIGETLSPYTSAGQPIDMIPFITYGISSSREYDPSFNSILGNICFKIFSTSDPPTTDVKLS